jgi:hypothetical protein
METEDTNDTTAGYDLGYMTQGAYAVTRMSTLARA